MDNNSGEIFISYKRERRRAAEHLAEILRRHGYTVWFDYHLIKGKDFTSQLQARIKVAKVLIVLWCKLSVDSRMVKEEVDLATERGILVPSMIEDCERPLFNRLDDYVDLTQWDGSPRSHHLDPLLAAVAQKVGRDPVPNFFALQDYEAIWRRFGAPTLKTFALDNLPRESVLVSSTLRKPRPSRPVDAAARQGKHGQIETSVFPSLFQLTKRAHRIGSLRGLGAAATLALGTAIMIPYFVGGRTTNAPSEPSIPQPPRPVRPNTEEPKLEEEKRHLEQERARQAVQEEARRKEEAALKKANQDQELRTPPSNNDLERKRIDNQKRQAEFDEYKSELAKINVLLADNPSSGMHYLRGELHLKAKEYNLAIADYTSAIRGYSKHADAYYRRASALVEIGNYDSAVNDFTEAIKHSKGFHSNQSGNLEMDSAIAENSIATAYHGRALAHLKAGRPAPALSDIDRSLRLRPKSPLALTTRGLVYEALGEREKAVTELRKALSIRRDIPSAIDALKRLGASP